MPELLLIAIAFSLGLLGNIHCIGMCGGLMGALTMAIPPQQRARRLQFLLAYNLGRILSYTAAGLLFGLAGWTIAQSPLVSAIRFLAGILMILMGLYIGGLWNVLTHLEALGKGLWKHIQLLAERLLPVKTLPHALLLGILWGWLPCGLVYTTLIWAASQGNAGTSALLMLAFGLGTLPLLLITGLATGRLNALLQHRGLRLTAGILIIAFGIWTIPGPHQHWLMGH